MYNNTYSHTDKYDTKIALAEIYTYAFSTQQMKTFTREV